MLSFTFKFCADNRHDDVRFRLNAYTIRSLPQQCHSLKIHTHLLCHMAYQTAESYELSSDKLLDPVPAIRLLSDRARHYGPYHVFSHNPPTYLHFLNVLLISSCTMLRHVCFAHGRQVHRNRSRSYVQDGVQYERAMAARGNATGSVVHPLADPLADKHSIRILVINAPRPGWLLIFSTVLWGQGGS